MKTLLEDLVAASEKRRFVRFDIDIPALVRQADGGRPIQAVAKNISFDGIQIHCPLEGMHDLSSPTQPSSFIDGMNVDIGLRVSLKTGIAMLSARCSVCYVGKTDGGMVVLGMQFTQFYGDGAAIKDAFLRELLEPYLNCFEAYTQTWARRKPS